MKQQIKDYVSAGRSSLAAEIVSAIMAKAPDANASSAVLREFDKASDESPDAGLLYATRTLYAGVEQGRWPWSPQD